MIFTARKSPLILPNIWDIHSAVIAQQAGFSAIGTSSAAIAAYMGVPDGEQMPFSMLVKLVADIRRHTDIPLTVDIEGGYSAAPEQVAENINTLIHLGVTGINIEDSMIAGRRQLLSIEVFCHRLQQIVSNLGSAKNQLFINARCDLFFQSNPTATEAISRAKFYQQSGVDGIFFPGLTNHNDIVHISQCSGQLIPDNKLSRFSA
ncbi:isocitrate lyase/PEP mutase family protein [Shewanella sp. GXUN23E]|uniref:isocitrate lyase/PEP mutase family protein n=1 Tax=Shewanella sp. GXUN23E TaxID=3422498 RepID=UPI003D7C7486